MGLATFYDVDFFLDFNNVQGAACAKAWGHYRTSIGRIQDGAIGWRCRGSASSSDALSVLSGLEIAFLKLAAWSFECSF